LKENQLLYPIKFIPILKEKIWGGNKLNSLFNKKGSDKTGESWELSGVKGDISVIKNGALAGKTLNEVNHVFQDKLVGKKVYKMFQSTFPLLFKFIDASQDLSVQLHPNDFLAKKRHNSFGKTEMWYILESDENAKLIVGFKDKTDEELYKKKLKENQLSDILNSNSVKKGDAYFIKPGTVHAICAGVVLAEIQQTSDVTYRIYDYDRPDIDGGLRELHTELALKAIDFNISNAKLSYQEKENESTLICKSDYFTTHKLVLSKNIKRDLSKIDSFVVYMCVEGSGSIRVNNNSEEINKGETVLIPALATNITIKTNDATFLEVYIP